MSDEWEYQTENIYVHDDEDLATFLNEYGSDGWEVIDTGDPNSRDKKVVMKRRVRRSEFRFE